MGNTGNTEELVTLESRLDLWCWMRWIRVLVFLFLFLKLILLHLPLFATLILSLLIVTTNLSYGPFMSFLHPCCVFKSPFYFITNLILCFRHYWDVVISGRPVNLTTDTQRKLQTSALP